MLTLQLDPFPTLNTPRLMLRNIGLTDVNELYALRNHPLSLTYLDRGPDRDVSHTLQLIQTIHKHIVQNESIVWGITLKDNPALIGTIGFWNTELHNHRGELGYMLHPSLHNQGIMSEALAHVIDYGFNEMRFHSIMANINPANQASKKLLLKNHFRQEAYFRENHYFDGKFMDTAIYGLLAHEYFSKKQ